MPVLSKNDVLAIKQATSVSFHVVSGVGTINLRKRSPYSPVFQAKDQEYALQADYYMYVDGTRYGGDSGRADPFTLAFASTYAESGWAVVQHMVKAGDRLVLNWWADCYGGGAKRNGYLSACEITPQGAKQMLDDPAFATPIGTMHADALMVEIIRTLPSGKRKTWSLVMSVNICPDNSARMLRP